MAKRWSKLQKEFYLIRTEKLDLQIQCRLYRMKSQRGQTNIPRYWITINNEIIWDYPKDFMGNDSPASVDSKDYPHVSDISAISDLIRDYIDTPKSEVFDKLFTNDLWGLTDILKASDKRVGYRRLSRLKKTAKSEAVDKVVAARESLRQRQSTSGLFSRKSSVISLDEVSFRNFEDVVEAATSENAKLDRLLSEPAPWELSNNPDT